MKRIYEKPLLEDLQQKPIILSGPRQCGKTYLSKRLFPESCEYLSFDLFEDRKKIVKLNWNRSEHLVILDEIHKMKKWKSWLKNIFDSDKEIQKFLITGSAKLNTFKKVGDSLAGRYFSYRMYPFDLKEVLSLAHLDWPGNLKQDPKSVLDRLMDVTGFPEPFIAGTQKFFHRWQQTHLDVILRQDILETENLRNIKQLEILTLLLAERVGSTLSYNSLREDLSTDDKSVKRWVDILENSYVCFKVLPYTHKSLATGLKKAPKVYFFDYGRVEASSFRFENLVAFSLLKEIHFRKDILGENYDLHYAKNKQHKEIDFVVTKNRKPHLLIEVKEGDDSPSDNFKSFGSYFPNVQKIQLVRNLTKKTLTKNGVWIWPAHEWLAQMDFGD